MLTTPLTGPTVAFGDGPVRFDIANAGDLRHGDVVLGRTNLSGWLALKTHFFAGPSYPGPFVVRVTQLDRRGRVELGGDVPKDAPLVVPPREGAMVVSGWREFPIFTWMRSPGCYAWSIDGIGFEETAVLRAVPPTAAKG